MKRKEKSEVEYLITMVMINSNIPISSIHCSAWSITKKCETEEIQGILGVNEESEFRTWLVSEHIPVI